MRERARLGRPAHGRHTSRDQAFSSVSGAGVVPPSLLDKVWLVLLRTADPAEPRSPAGRSGEAHHPHAQRAARGPAARARGGRMRAARRAPAPAAPVGPASAHLDPPCAARCASARSAPGRPERGAQRPSRRGAARPRAQPARGGGPPTARRGGGAPRGRRGRAAVGTRDRRSAQDRRPRSMNRRRNMRDPADGLPRARAARTSAPADMGPLALFTMVARPQHHKVVSRPGPGAGAREVRSRRSSVEPTGSAGALRALELHRAGCPKIEHGAR